MRTALEELLSLAEQGNATAQYRLGVMYDGGFGVAQDYAEAMKWYRLAAESRMREIRRKPRAYPEA